MASYVSLAFGRYVVEPFFAPCAAPMALIKLISILGVSECCLTPLSTLPSHCYVCPRSARLRSVNFFSGSSPCPCSICGGSQLLECDHGLTHSDHADFHQDVCSGPHHHPWCHRTRQRWESVCLPLTLAFQLLALEKWFIC